MKHKHADLIHAWADGAEIQANYADVWRTEQYPYWAEEREYRIKPEEKKPVVRWLWAYPDDDIYGGYVIDTYYMTEIEAMLSRNKPIKLEWSRTEFPE